MSFYADLLNNPSHAVKQHLPSNVNAEVHANESDGFPTSQQLRLPPLNRFNVQRIKPQTNLPVTLFSNGNIVDIKLNPSYTERLWLELEFNVVTAPVTLNLDFAIEYLEILSGNTTISVIRDVNFLHSWLFKSYETTVRQATNANKNSSLVSQALPIGFYRKYIHLDCFVDSCQPKLNMLKDQIILKIHFQDKCVIAGSNANVQVQLCDVLAETQELMTENLETQRKQAKMLRYRFLNPIRATNESITMNANQTYNFRLTSLNSMTSHLIFHIRLAGALPDVFSQVDFFEFLNSNNQVQGTKCSHQQSRIISESMPGWLASLNEAIYIIPFSFVNLAKKGVQAGFWKMDTLSQIRIYTPSTWVNGSYTFECYGYEYNTLHIDKGVVSLSK